MQAELRLHAHHMMRLPVQNAMDTNSCNRPADYSYLREAHDAGLVSDADITRSAQRVLRARSRLGMFEPPSSVPFADIGGDVIGAAEHKAAAVEAVEKGSDLQLMRPGAMCVRQLQECVDLTRGYD